MVLIVAVDTPVDIPKTVCVVMTVAVNEFVEDKYAGDSWDGNWGILYTDGEGEDVDLYSSLYVGYLLWTKSSL